MTTKRQIARGCRHFNGVQHDTCEAGVAYAQYLYKNAPNLPCIPRTDGTLSGLCPAFAFLSEEEIETEERRQNEAIKKFLKNLEDDICPHCGVNLGDMTCIAVLCQIIHGGPINPHWLDSMEKHYRHTAEKMLRGESDGQQIGS